MKKTKEQLAEEYFKTKYSEKDWQCPVKLVEIIIKSRTKDFIAGNDAALQNIDWEELAEKWNQKKIKHPTPTQIIDFLKSEIK